MKPRILVLANQESQNYAHAIETCGGEAIIKYMPDLDVDYDGLVLCGGNDILPKYYGEKIDGARDFDPERDETEIALTCAFINTGKPILGICRGLQLLNVVLGGTLIQDLDNADFHRSHNKIDGVHSVTAKGFLQELYGSDFNVNTSHHQAIKTLGKGLVVSACADNVIEAIEHESLPYYAVQFHPERMCLKHAKSDTIDGIKIFEKFVNLCKSKSV